jgi:hypothetical protein
LVYYGNNNSFSRPETATVSIACKRIDVSPYVNKQGRYFENTIFMSTQFQNCITIQARPRFFIGAFQTVNLPVGVRSAILVKDFNNDGISEQFISLQDGQPYYMTSDLKGGYKFRWAGTRFAATQACVGDFNGDGKLDTAASSLTNKTRIYINVQR